MPFGNIGIGGLVLILIIALIIFGPLSCRSSDEPLDVL